MHGENAVLVISEIGEFVDVFPYPLVRGMEQVGTVFMHLNAGFFVCFGIAVSAKVGALFDDEHLFAQLIGRAFCDGEAEKSGSDNDEVICSHALQTSGALRALVGATKARA